VNDATLPGVPELPIRLEPFAADSVAAVVTSRPASCAVPPPPTQGSSLMTSVNIRLAIAAIVAASCIAIPVSASAQTLPPTFRSDAAQSPGTQPEPTTVEVVQPARTIVRDVDEVLPIVLSGTALLAVLALFGFTLVRTRVVPRPGRSH
jgi:hypothetical protein